MKRSRVWVESPGPSWYLKKFSKTKWNLHGSLIYEAISRTGEGWKGSRQLHNLRHPHSCDKKCAVIISTTAKINSSVSTNWSIRCWAKWSDKISLARSLSCSHLHAFDDVCLRQPFFFRSCQERWWSLSFWSDHDFIVRRMGGGGGGQWLSTFDGFDWHLKRFEQIFQYCTNDFNSWCEKTYKIG